MNWKYLIMKIDKKTYKIDKKNYYQTKYTKKQIILAGSLRKDNYHIKRLQKKEYGKTKKWCTYSIARDGVIYQHYDPHYYSDLCHFVKISVLLSFLFFILAEGDCIF